MERTPVPVTRTWRRPMLLLLQALTAILFAALTVHSALLLWPESREIRSAGVELYFLAAIANLVFFHTLELHVQQPTTWKVILYTALGSIAISLLLSTVYYFIAVRN